MNGKQVLVATVGLGNIDQLRVTLLEPMKRSIESGTWGRVVLVPSTITRELADQLRAEIKDLPIELAPLEQPGSEDDLPACRAHLRSVFQRVVESGTSPEDIVLDFTRGTKVMSVAATLAAMKVGVRRIQYVVGGQRDARGVVVPGTEQVKHADL